MCMGKPSIQQTKMPEPIAPPKPDPAGETKAMKPAETDSDRKKRVKIGTKGLRIDMTNASSVTGGVSSLNVG